MELYVVCTGGRKMSKKLSFAVCVASVLFLVSGCADTPMRHLASDASLIQGGVTTRQDILNYFGEPDVRSQLPDGKEKWVFNETRKSTLRKVPYIGEYAGSEEHDSLIVLLAGDVVSEAAYRTFEPDKKGPTALHQQ